MDFELSPEREMIKSTVRDIASDYDHTYWESIHAEQRPPRELFEDLADGGWFGVPLPEEYGGQDMGILDLVLVLEALAEEHAWEATVRFTMSTVFGGLSILEHGTDEQQRQYIPGIAEGEDVWSLGMTEPDAGLNSARISTSAEREGEEFVINGRKQWTSGIEMADNLLLMTRTEPFDESNRNEGLTMFIVDPDSQGIEYSEIPLDIYFTEPTYDVFIDDLRVHEDQILGEEGEGLYQIFSMLNMERITAGMSTWSAGKEALDRAVDYANERHVWSEPIGAHQAIQHPLADAYADMETARNQLRKAAWHYDNQIGDVGEVSNIANLQAGKAAWDACEAAMTTFGGMSASQEIGIAAAWGVVRHWRTGPVSEEMIRNHIAQNSLGLPRSYET